MKYFYGCLFSLVAFFAHHMMHYEYVRCGKLVSDSRGEKSISLCQERIFFRRQLHHNQFGYYEEIMMQRTESTIE